jgi:hypothetical protein
MIALSCVRKGNLFAYFTSFIGHHRLLPFSCFKKEKANLPRRTIHIYLYLLHHSNHVSSGTIHGNN